jgi:DNA-binding transcriptional ArsR family regulator
MVTNLSITAQLAGLHGALAPEAPKTIRGRRRADVLSYVREHGPVCNSAIVKGLGITHAETSLALHALLDLGQVTVVHRWKHRFWEAVCQ